MVIVHPGCWVSHVTPHICRATRVEENPMVTQNTRCLWRLNNDNFLNREGSGGAWAPTTQTGLANKRKAFLLFEAAAKSWESTLFLPTTKCTHEVPETKCQAKCSVPSPKTKCPECTYALPFIGSVTSC